MADNNSDNTKRGFAAMSDSKQKEIASKGGKASHGGGQSSSSHKSGSGSNLTEGGQRRGGESNQSS